MTAGEKLLANALEGRGVISMHTWAEIRRLFEAGVPKKRIARQLRVNPRTVRRALEHDHAPIKRASPKRGRKLDAVESLIVEWLTTEPKLTAKRIGDLIAELIGPVSERTVREFVAEVRRKLRPKEAFVHRTHEPGDTMEADFGEAWVRLAGEEIKVHFLVVTLPFSNAYFAKAYRLERLESLLDGLLAAFEHFGGLPVRLVLDNLKLAVNEVRKGKDRKEQIAFEAFRGELKLAVDYCAPAKGNEKGSVEGGVKYVRNNCFRPMPEVESMDELNAMIVATLQRDLPRRPHSEGGSAAAALSIERAALRPLPSRLPQPCRTSSATANKFAHVRVDGVTYSLPIEFAYRAVTVKLFADRVRVAVDDAVVAEHPRVFEKGRRVLDWRHVLDLLERKSRAVPEATALRGMNVPKVFFTLREALHTVTRHADREWVSVLKLLRDESPVAVTAAVEAALQAGSPRLATIRQLLRHQQTPVAIVEPVPLLRDDLAAMDVPAADLSAYDALIDERGEVA